MPKQSTPVHEIFRFVEVGAVREHLGVGRGIDAATHLPAQLCAGVVDNSQWHVVDGFGVINEGVEQRVGKRQGKEEEHCTHVAEHGYIFLAPDVAYVGQSRFYRFEKSVFHCSAFLKVRPRRFVCAVPV